MTSELYYYCCRLARICTSLTFDGLLREEREEAKERERENGLYIYVYARSRTTPQASLGTQHDATRCGAENGMGRPWSPGQWSRAAAAAGRREVESRAAWWG